jgi:hypothetical protein
VTALDDDPDLLPDPATGAAGGAAGPGSFADVHAFVAGLLAPAYARAVRDADSHAKWCPHWPDHPAAAWRLDALWRAWEALPDDDPDATCSWWLAKADPTMAALCDPRTGPFAGCGPTRHRRPDPLPVLGAEPAASAE